MNLKNKILILFNRQEKKKLFYLLILMLISTMFETLGIGLIVPFVSIVINAELIQTQPSLSYIYYLLDFKSTTDFLIFATVVLITLFLLKNLYLIIYHYIQYRIIYNQQINLSKRLFKHYLTSPYTFHLQSNSSELLRNINSEVTRVFNLIILPIFLMISELLVITGITILLIIKAPFETLLSAIILGSSAAIFFKVFRNKVNKHGIAQQVANGEMIKWVNQGLGAVKDVKVTGRESFFIENFVEQSRTFSKTMRFFQMLNQLPRLFIETIIVSTILVIISFIIIQDKDTTALISTLALFAMGAFRLMPSINRIVNSITSIRFNLSALDLIINELKEESRLGVNPSRETESYDIQKGFNTEIQLQNIFYKYPNQSKYVIENLSLTIKKGESIAFIGTSGAGKTTIVDIILGLLDPEKGKILVDGIELKDQLSQWKKRIGYIPQFIYLSDDSIKHNIAFGLKDNEIDDAAIWKAIEDSQLSDFVSELPEGIDTFVGERGVRLSGGQRQRIGIARALYNNPEILFLDEATSSLDNETEKEIIKAIDGLKREKTLIVIAHRISTIENCDKVYEVVNGEVRIVERVLD